MIERRRGQGWPPVPTKEKENQVERILSLLEGVRQVGPGKFVARCPAHEDHTPSLSIAEADDGRILMHCFAGCSIEEICSSLGISLRDLFPNSPRTFKQRVEQQNKALLRRAIRETLEEVLNCLADLLRRLDYELLQATTEEAFSEPLATLIDQRDYAECLWDETRRGKGDIEMLNKICEVIERWKTLLTK